jgi:hypothetical protein
VTCQATPISGLNTIEALAGDGGTLYALGEQSGSTFAVVSVATVPGKTTSTLPSIKATTIFKTPTAGNATPTFLAATGSTLCVSYTGGTSTGAGIWIYNTTKLTAAPQAITLPKPAASLAATSSALYLLLNDGTLGEVSLQPSGSRQFMPLSVDVLTPVQPTDPSTYAVGTPVPTATSTTGGSQSTAPFPSSSALAVAPGQSPQLLVGDATNARVVDLNISTSGPGLAPHVQFVYGTSGSGSGFVTATSNGSNLIVFAYNGSAVQVFVVPQSALQG